MISLFSTYISSSAQEIVNSLLSSTYLSEGHVTKKFESELERQLGLVNCVAVNSGTSALHLALVLANVKPGDEVIIPAQTFVATGLVVLQQYATPIFADISYTNGNISPESVRSKITSKTKAIIVVHWAGYPCDLDEIHNIASEYSIPVIEDAAHALGAEYRGQSIGSISPFTCFSFQAIKHLTTGDGGALCVNSTDLKRHATSRRWFGIDRENSLLTAEGERDYNISLLGFKYHLNNYAAALGLANIQGLSQRLENRRVVAEYYNAQLDLISGIKRFTYGSDRKSAYWLYGAHVERRNDFIRALRDRGIETSVVHQRIDKNMVFGGHRSDLENQKLFDETKVHLPIHDGIHFDSAEQVIHSIKLGW